MTEITYDEIVKFIAERVNDASETVEVEVGVYCDNLYKDVLVCLKAN